MHIIEAVKWAPSGDALRIIDQTRLPEVRVERDLRSLEEICQAIETLAVRGAPAIGVAAAIGLVVTVLPLRNGARDRLLSAIERNAAALRATRPTAVNLPWALDRMLQRARSTDGNSGELFNALREEATAILDEDRAMCRRIGEHGLPLIPDGARVLTHCNAGALATSGIGTALAPIYLAVEQGRRVEVFVDETRPLLQGSRLTAWELDQAGIPVTVLTDNMSASLMHSGVIDLCIVGADRIAANGDVANKIGTYPLAVLARHHDIPIYVAAPTSTFDPTTATGADIVIEQRPGREVANGFGTRTAPEGVRIYNPAFDVTPADLVTAIVSDRGLHRAPYLFDGSNRSAKSKSR